jgi:hypothetical protein
MQAFLPPSKLSSLRCHCSGKKRDEGMGKVFSKDEKILIVRERKKRGKKMEATKKFHTVRCVK